MNPESIMSLSCLGVEVTITGPWANPLQNTQDRLVPMGTWSWMQASGKHKLFLPGGPGEEGKAQGDIEVRVGVDGALKIGQKWLYGPPPHGRQSPGSGSGRWQSRGCHVAFSSQRDWVPGWWVFPVHSILLLCASVCLPRVAARN